MTTTRPWWHWVTANALIVATSPLWLTCYALGVLLGFTYDFLRVGFTQGPRLAEWLYEASHR